MSNLHKSHDVDLESANNNNDSDNERDVGDGPTVGEGAEPVPSDANEIFENGKDMDESRESNVSECSVVIVVDLDSNDSKLHLGRDVRDCRICHLSIDANDLDSGFPIELGCSCKDDLAAAHQQCAETWFKIKGNKTCEICGSIAQNVTGVNEGELPEHWDETNDAAATGTATAPLSGSRNFWQGHRFLNFLLACMVFAFVISWLFHFNVPS